jgi:hypothetical protein
MGRIFVFFGVFFEDEGRHNAQRLNLDFHSRSFKFFQSQHFVNVLHMYTYEMPTEDLGPGKTPAGST